MVVNEAAVILWKSWRHLRFRTKGDSVKYCYGTASCLIPSHLINHASPILSNELFNTSVWLCYCYGTALIFHFFSLFGLVDIIIKFKGEHMVNTCCSTTHGFLMFDCALLRTSWLPHVEYSRTTYIRIPQDTSYITHVFHLVYIVYQIAY